MSLATHMPPCEACGGPTHAKRSHKRYCDPCRKFRLRVQKAKSRNRDKPTRSIIRRDWLDAEAPLTRMDRQFISAGLGSECYSCKYLAVCRANVWSEGFKLPCFEER